jgi:Uma2 family endonuclease
MSATSIPAPRRHLVTVQEYLRMGETGVLSADGRFELVEGEIIDMPPIGPPHASDTNLLARLLTLALGDRAIVSSQNPVVLGVLSAPQPDIAVLRPRDDFYRDAHPKPDDVLLVVEVSDSSLSHDRDRKLPLYARFGIPEAWLIEVAHRLIDIHRDPVDGRYTTQFRLHPPALISPVMLPDLTLDLSPLL